MATVSSQLLPLLLVGQDMQLAVCRIICVDTCVSRLTHQLPMKLLQWCYRCHWGPCPPCSHFCGIPHSCGHACSSPSCHDRPPPSIPAFPHPLPPVSVTFTPTKPVQHETSQTESRTPAVQVSHMAMLLPEDCCSLW